MNTPTHRHMRRLEVLGLSGVLQALVPERIDKLSVFGGRDQVRKGQLRLH